MRRSLLLPLVSFMTFLLSTPTAAHLSPEERYKILEVAIADGGQPDYCSACLRKGMTNHFPHACHHGMPDPIAVASKPGMIKVEIVRCICVAFTDPRWMAQDCQLECEFTRHTEAMNMIPKVQDFPGCDQWVDFKTLAELEVPGFTKADPNHQPEVYDYEEEKRAAIQLVEMLGETMKEGERMENPEEEELDEDEDDEHYEKGEAVDAEFEDDGEFAAEGDADVDIKRDNEMRKEGGKFEATVKSEDVTIEEHLIEEDENSAEDGGSGSIHTIKDEL